YAAPTGGTVVGVTSLTVPTVREFYRDHFRPDRSLLAIAGDVNPDSAFAAIADAFESWSGKAAAERPFAAAPAGAPRVRIVDRPELARCEIRIGLTGPGRSSADALPFSLANWVLGGSRGSRLVAAGGPRDARSSFTPLRGGGLLAVAASAAPDSAA